MSDLFPRAWRRSRQGLTARHPDLRTRQQEEFMPDKDPSDVRCVEGSFLALTGPGSVFECLIIALFSRSDVCSKPASNALYIADYMIALMWQSCNGERAASHTRGPWFWLYETPGEKRALGKCGGVAWSPGKALPFAPRSPLSKHQAHGHNSKTRPLRDYSTAVTRFLLLGASPCYETRA